MDEDDSSLALILGAILTCSFHIFIAISEKSRLCLHDYTWVLESHPTGLYA